MADQFDYRLLARGVDPIKLDNPLDNALAAAKVQGAQSQNALVGAQAQQAQRTMGIQNELDNFDGTDPSKLSRPAQKQFALDQAATHKAQIEDHLKKFEVIGQIMSGVQDQATYDRARQQAVQVLGADAVKNMNPVYDANEIEQNRIQAVGVKDQLANQLKMMEFKSKDADRQEMMNYRRDMLGIAQQNANSNAARVNSMGAQSDLDPETIDRVAHFAIANGGSVPAGTYAFGKAGNPMRDAVNNRITAIQKGDTGSVDWSQQANNVIQNKADNRAQMSASSAFASGKQGQMLNANNTALHHAAALRDLYDGLNNGQLQTPNQIENYFKQKTGQSGITSYKAAQGIVAKEIINSIIPGGGGIEERIAAEKNLDPNLSPEQFNSNLAALEQLMAARRESLVQQGTALRVNPKILSPFGKPSAPAHRISMDSIRAKAAANQASIEDVLQEAAAQGFDIYGD